MADQLNKKTIDGAKALIKEARAVKRAFVPMPGGQQPQPQPMDPAMMAGGGGMPMDPAMAGGGQPPMDPAMMAGGGGMPADPSMGGQPMDPAMAGGEQPEPTIAELPVSMFQELLADTIMSILEGGGEEGAMPPEEGAPPEGAPSDVAEPTNTQLMERIGMLEEALMQIAGPPQGGPAGMAPPPPPPGGGGQMELQAADKDVHKPSLADMLINSVARLHEG